MGGDHGNFTWTEIKAGLLVLTSLVLFMAFAAAVAGLRTPENTVSYHARFTDTLGLNKGAPVRFGGARVGRVTDILLDSGDQTQVTVEFQIKPETPVNAGSVAYIGQTSLTAEKHIEITTGLPDAVRIEPGSEIPTRIQLDAFAAVGDAATRAAEFLEGAKDILGTDRYAVDPEVAAREGKEELVSVPRILKHVDEAVSEAYSAIADNRQHFGDIIIKIRKLEDALEGLVGQLGQILEENRPVLKDTLIEAHGAVGDARSSMARLDGILQNVGNVSDRLDSFADSLEATLANSQVITSDTRDILKETRPEIEDLVFDLRDTARQARELVRNLKEQPQSVIMGQQPQGRKR